MKKTESLKNQTIGIEIEMTGLTREKAARTIADHLGTRARYEGGSYYAYKVPMSDGREWTVLRDSSIRPQVKKGRTVVNNYDDEFKVEVTSPILRYDDIETLQEIVRALRRAGAIVNSSTGIHIHIGAEKFTPETLRNIINIIASKEDILYKALDIDPDRVSYCQKTNLALISAINRERPTTMTHLKNIWYREDPHRIDHHYNSTRYHGLNLHALFTKGTVEFRLFNSSLHAGEIKAYIQFCLAVTNQALTQKRALARRTKSENERYTFRCWLLRLGLIGDEFKTCRHHLLKHLKGEIAWLHKPETAAA